MTNRTKIPTKNSLLAVMAFLVLGIIAHTFYIAATVYSNYIIGRDEANFVLRSTMAMLSAHNWHEWVAALTQTHGQHVLIGMQLGNLFSYYTFGHIDFQLINILGTFYLVVPVFLIIYKSRPNPEQAIWLAALAFPLALSPAHSSCAINAACTGNHYLGLCLSVISLYLFCSCKNVTILALAEFFLAMAVYSSPAALPLTLLAFVVLRLLQASHKSWLLIHGFFSLLILFTYYWATHPLELDSFGAGTISGLAITILQIVLTFFSILGSIFFLPDNIATGVASILIGLALFISGIWLVYRQLILLRQQETPAPSSIVFYVSGFILMLGMIVLISIGRHQEFGSSRYVFYPCFALIFLLFLLAATHKELFNKFRNLLVLLCMAYYPVELILDKPYLDGIRDEIVICEQHWHREGKACGAMIKHEEATRLLLEAEAHGILKLEHSP